MTRKVGREKWGEESGASKDIEKSGTRKVEVRKVGREKWGRGNGARILRKVGRQMRDEKSGGEKSGTRKVEARKVGREKWGEESGSIKVGREKWGEKSRVR